MKTEKRASVLSSTQYPAEELTLYTDKSLKRVSKHKTSSTESCSFENINNDDYDTFASSSEPISYDLNTIDIEAIAASPGASIDYHRQASAERFQTLDTQYEFDCSSYAKSSTEIHDLILKSEYCNLFCC